MADRVTAWRRRLLDGVALAASAALVAIAAVAAGQGVSTAEAAVFHALNDLPGLLYRPMWLAQFLGLLLLPAAVAVVALAFRRWRLAATLLLLIPLKLVVEKAVIKSAVYRARPGTSVCAGDPSCLTLRGDVPMVGPSFPSGHVIIVCGIAWLVAPYVGTRARWGLAVVCIVVAVARMYLGAHNPLDVVAGAAAGVGIAALLNLALGVPASRQDAAGRQSTATTR